MFYLSIDPTNIGGPTCPHCLQVHDIEWNTEYGEPIEGCHNTTCLECNKTFSMEVYIETIYTSTK